MRAEILDAVFSIPDGPCRTALLLYYVKCLPTWDSVANVMHYSRQHVVQRLHPEGLRYVEKTIHNDTSDGDTLVP